MRATAGPEPMTVLAESGIDQRLQYLQYCLLNQTVRHGGDAQFTFAAVRLRNANAPHRLWPVRAFHQLLPDRWPCVFQVLSGLWNVKTIDTRGSFVRLHAFPRALH